MAQNITLLGASYSDVPAVELPKTGGGTARFDDVTVTTATAEDVAQGKVFVASDGSITIGTATGGGGTGGAHMDADGYLVLDDEASSSGISLIDTITVPADTRAVNIDFTQYSAYDILIVTEDVELTESDWLYYSPNASTPTGGTYNDGSKLIHQGVAAWKLRVGGSNGGVATGRPATKNFATDGIATTVDNILIYTYVATKYIKAGSTFKVYGGKYADL